MAKKSSFVLTLVNDHGDPYLVSSSTKGEEEKKVILLGMDTSLALMWEKKPPREIEQCESRGLSDRLHKGTSEMIKTNC